MLPSPRTWGISLKAPSRADLAFPPTAPSLGPGSLSELAPSLSRLEMENWKLVFRPSFSESIAPSLCYLAPETVPLPGSPLVGPLCCSWWASMVPLSLASALEAQRWLPWDCRPFWTRYGLPTAFSVAWALLPSLTGWVGSWGNRQGLPSQLCPGAGVAVHDPEVKGRGWVVRSMKGLSGFFRAQSGSSGKDLNSETLLGLTLCPWKRRKMLFGTESKWVTDSSHWDPLAHKFFFLKKRKKSPRQHNLL